MAKKRYLKGLYDNLKSLQDDFDIGMDKYSYDQFKAKYGTKKGINTDIYGNNPFFFNSKYHFHAHVLHPMPSLDVGSSTCMFSPVYTKSCS